MDYSAKLANEFNLRAEHSANIVALIDEGNTIPFIARYRKEMTGSCDDQVLREFSDRLKYLRNLDKRKQEVSDSITEQGKMTDEITLALVKAETMTEVEDIYRPFKQKRKTRASVAAEKGLSPLAEFILLQDKNADPLAEAEKYVNAEKGVETVDAALEGAGDIVAEWISDDAAIRKSLRGLMLRRGTLAAEAAADEDSVYRLYYEFSQPLSKLRGHQILAINRGEKEGFLKVRIDIADDIALPVLRRAVLKPGSASMAFVRAAADDA